MSIFVVHEHHASHLHWDFRIELDGVLKSWAVPKEPPLETGIRRLAVAVDDHPLSYVKFSGEIRSGYGKGTVAIWDSGDYELKSRKEKKLVVVMHGKKMIGRYTLLKFEKAKNGWLLFKNMEK